MNLSTILMLFAAWQLLKNSSSQKKETPAITDFLSNDAKSMLNCVEKLTSKQSSQEDKTGAILQMISNPSVIELTGKLFNQAKKETAARTDDSAKKCDCQNDEGYTFQEPSKDSKDFFQPIENIADTEIKHKLYWFYDNWYIK